MMKRVFLSISLLLFIFLLCNFFMIQNILNVYAESVIESQQVNEESSGDAEELERTLQNTSMSDEEAVQNDKASLSIGYQSGDSEYKVRYDINLPTSGNNGTIISWRSDKPSLIGTNGKVTIPTDSSTNRLVTLTATINRGYVFDTKEFRIWVADTLLTDEEAVAEDMANIEIGYAPGDSQFSVTQNVSLPRWGKNKTEISWYAYESSAMKDDGRVIRPSYLEEDVLVTLVATVRKGGEWDHRQFLLKVIKVELSDAEIVSKDKDGLIIHYSSGDNASSVTQDINLPVKGTYGTNISWSSSNPSVLGNDGKVTRPDYTEEDITVTLTAMINKGSVSDTRQFTITVKKGEITDEDAIAFDAAALKIGYADGDSAHSVTQDLYLPTWGSNGSKISWFPRNSGTSGSVYSDGRVFRPNYSEGNATKYLDAVIQKGNATCSRGFYITLIEEEMSHADAVALDKENLKIDFAPGDSQSSVTQNINLPRNGENGTSILWGSYNQNTVGTNGIVKRPSSSEADIVVKLKATIVKRTVSDEKEFLLTVKKEDMNDTEAVASDKENLEIGYSPGDSSSEIVYDISLPINGSNGTSISWSSNKSSIIGTDGKVNRPSSSQPDAIVILTATISRGSASDTKQFTLKVRNEWMTDTQIIDLDKDSLEIGYSTGDSRYSVEHDISLPVKGNKGSNISWSSNKPSIIGSDGKVNRPSVSESDEIVTLTATISKGSASDTKQFIITVKKLLLSDDEAVDSDKSELEIGYFSDDSSSAVEHDISLPTRGSNGTKISWSSNKSNIIGSDGKVNRPSATESDEVVKLTATISKGSASDTKQFELTVKKLDENNPNTPSENADLMSLSIKEKKLRPNFNMNTYKYEVDVPEKMNTVNLSATVYDEKASMKINGISVPDNAIKTIELNIGENVVSIEVTAEDNKHFNRYTVLINRNKEVYEKSQIENNINEANSIDNLKEAYIHVDDLNDKDKEDVLKLLTNKSLDLMNDLENVDFIQSVIDEIEDDEEREVYEKRVDGKRMIYNNDYKSWNENNSSPQPKNKIWSVKFSSKLDKETIIVGDDYLTVVDEDGYRIGIELEYIEENNNLKIKPVSNYKSGKKYYLVMGKEIRSEKGYKLNRAVRLEFSVER